MPQSGNALIIEDPPNMAGGKQGRRLLNVGKYIVARVWQTAVGASASRGSFDAVVCAISFLKDVAESNPAPSGNMLSAQMASVPNPCIH